MKATKRGSWKDEKKRRWRIKERNVRKKIMRIMKEEMGGKEDVNEREGEG